MARYRIQRQWPVQGVMVEGGTVVDDASPTYQFLRGVIPPPDCQPLDQETYDWLVAAYVRDYGYPAIAPPPPTEAQNEQTKRATPKSPKSK